MSKLEDLRQSIDQLDQELVRLFERRMAVTREVGEYKQANGIPVLDTAREREVLAKKVNLISNQTCKRTWCSCMRTSWPSAAASSGAWCWRGRRTRT